jgi:UDP-2-acetamido-2-deoxy-ribo-hexuluronate aminotransferase
LLAKLTHYKKEIELRQQVAQTYNHKLAYHSELGLPQIKTDRTSVWAQYTLRTKQRDPIQQKLKQENIPTAIHYPKPLHLQECLSYLAYKEGAFPIAEKAANEVISLPMNGFVTEIEMDYIVENLSK